MATARGPVMAPAYRHGVLVIDGVELSTTHGHYLALGLGQAPYRLAGDAADVVEDVRRLGGFGIVAHPDSSKPGLAWRDWQAPVDGLEWFNLDSEWRDDRRAAGPCARPLSNAAGAALARSPVTAAACSRAGRTSRRERRVFGVASVDAHARMGSEGGFDRAWMSVRPPGYEAVFSTAQVSLELDAALGGDAGRRCGHHAPRAPRGAHLQPIAARGAAGRVAIAANEAASGPAWVSSCRGPAPSRSPSKPTRRARR